MRARRAQSYGSQESEDVTGSIVQVDSKQIMQTAVAGAADALQGRAAGVEVVNSNGAPGSNTEVRIRGLGSINGSPALYDLDNSGDLEIIFTTDYNSSGKVYAINYNGENVDGFPVDIGEKMLVGAAVADLENDGIADIVVCTWGENIYSLTQNGTIKNGFPFTSGKRFNAPPTLVDLTLDGNLEIVAGNDDGILPQLPVSQQTIRMAQPLVARTT